MNTPTTLATTIAPLSLDSVLRASVHVAIFMIGLFVASRFLPGPEREGLPLPDGRRLRYRVNGMASWVVLHLVIVGATFGLGLSLAPLVRDFWAYFVVMNGVSVLFTLGLYVSGRPKQPEAERGRGPLGLVRDLWMGVELNPTLFGVDLKTWAYQPSLLGLAVLNLAFAYVQYEDLGRLTPQMIAYQLFWWTYLTSHYWYEEGIFSMWDVIAEKFGFMLVWGDLVLVPFFYCIGGFVLVTQTEAASLIYLGVVAGLHLLGLWIFRGANDQKNRFKRDKSARIWGKPAETLGGRLLISGFWGIGRKLNYGGEILVYVSFALTSGFVSPWPYLLPAWLLSLLLHRAWRDEQRCRAKYGALWDDYCKRASFRFIPFVY